ncbi:translation machinery-associated protein 16 [Hylaeus anthracinus]|uniref:translation machinery-associated protein 16 n=1 Tax=Hylaeus anthracinus TaxID=313031 RepID=UPI0023BA2D74|nr:translation machinery-associated protein 16 [Hylaeus anthracinus]
MSAAMRKEYLKAKKIVHPNSRKSIAIAKRAKKISNRQKTKMGNMIKQNLIGEKMLWIQEHMVQDACPYTPELTARLLETYISRNDEELEQINIKHSVGGKRSRQHASREDVIRMTKEREQEEYDTCGIEIPDILNASQCEMLRKWNGELKYMTNFKFRRFGKKHLNDALQKAIKHSKEIPEKLGNHAEEITFENVENTLL